MKLLIPFTKFQGLGNDFVVVDARELVRERAGYDLLGRWRELASEIARQLCDRNFGIGADGLILALPLDVSGYDLVERPLPPQSTSSESPAAADKSGKVHELSKNQKIQKNFCDFPRRHDRSCAESGRSLLEIEEIISRVTEGYPGLKSDADDACHLGWVYTNSDGSESDMCGNGLRSIALWAFNNIEGLPGEFRIATRVGPVTAQVSSDDEIRVNIGKPSLESRLIPVISKDAQSLDKVVRVPLNLPGGDDREAMEVLVTCVGMGNPHAIVYEQFDGEVGQAYSRFANEKRPDRDFFPEHLKDIARRIQENPFFPEGVNVEFVQQESDESVNVLVYERGCGATLACASGACAVVVAGVLEERLQSKATVRLPGGELQISWDEESGTILMQGAAREVFSGVVWVNLNSVGERALSNA